MNIDGPHPLNLQRACSEIGIICHFWGPTKKHTKPAIEHPLTVHAWGQCPDYNIPWKDHPMSNLGHF